MVVEFVSGERGWGPAAVLDSLGVLSEVAEFETDENGLASRLCFLRKRGVEFVEVCRPDCR